MSLSCGQGLSCAAACYSGHNCEDCDNVDEMIEESKQRKEGEDGTKARLGGLVSGHHGRLNFLARRPTAHGKITK